MQAAGSGGNLRPQEFSNAINGLNLKWDNRKSEEFFKNLDYCMHMRKHQNYL